MGPSDKLGYVWGATVKVKSVDDLSPSALAVIGLLNMGFAPLDIVRAFQDPRGRRRRKTELKVERLLRAVRVTRNPLIREYVDHGLPPGVHGRLPWVRYGNCVRCPLCRQRVNRVPCPACNQAWRGHELQEHRERWCRPTSAMPGTKEKIGVMAARADAGESLFHPNDANGRKP